MVPWNYVHTGAHTTNDFRDFVEPINGLLELTFQALLGNVASNQDCIHATFDETFFYYSPAIGQHFRANVIIYFKCAKPIFLPEMDV